ncbi:hypothetical protein AN958_08913 [Leucoagaricus sp. SymC.cos]|nr:hypothetical protein AN958_08913 [Leucoagaricus sp. SymC.cos]
MSESRRLQLRVLYTINSSGYILARSLAPVPVTFIYNDAEEIQPYAAIAFKTCLEAIRRSSPEFMQDRSRDYSVYVLDPLESNAAPAPMDISNVTDGRSKDTTSNSTPEQGRGVAVGMGLMSEALSVEEKDSMRVYGTLGKTGTGQDAIEVIIALREVCFQVISKDQTRLPDASLPCNIPQQTDCPQARPHTLPTAETLATIASIQNRTKAKIKPKKPPRVSSTVPVTESDKLLSADTYIGPVRKKGRPKGQSNGDTKVKAENSAAAAPQKQTGRPMSPQIPAICIGTSTTTTFQSITNVTPPSSQTSQPSEASCPPASSGLDLATVAALFSASQNEAARNTFFLDTLSLIDSPAPQGGQTAINPALVEALRQFLNACTQSRVEVTSTSTALPIPVPPSNPPDATPPSDDEVILLDKENVNPASVRRPGKDHEPSKFRGNDIRPNESNLEPAQNRGLGARSIENSPPRVTAATPAPAPVSNLRKRTLDDCMEERDSKRNKNHRTKGKDKERSDKKENPRFLGQQQSYENGFRHYPRLIPTPFARPEPGSISYYRTPIETWTSPPRPPRENLDPQAQMSDPFGGTSRNRPIVIPDSPQAPRVSASSPIKPTVQHKKPYVVPSWARTNTAMRPRLSEEAQKAVQALAEKKKEERRAQRRKTNAAAQGRHRQREKLANTENQDVSHSGPIAPTTFKGGMQPPPLPVIPSSDLPPIIASSDADVILFPPMPQRAQSPSPTRKTILLPPVTPQRPSRVASSTPGTTDFDEDSLFTPLSIARRSTDKFGSPLFSPGMPGSPLARKKSRISSPTAYRVAGNQFGSESSTITVKVHETSEDTFCKPKIPAPDPEDSLDDLDCPPSSLPIASSDNEFETTMSTQTAPNVTASVEDEELDEGYAPPRKQHWVGLPPSSPPPTSPCLMPMDDDGELQVEDIGEELPIASETDEPEDELDDMLNITDSESAPGPEDAGDVTITLPKTSPESTSPGQEVIDETAFFQQFTHLESSDGLSEGQPGIQGGENNDELSSFFSSSVDQLDFNGFLETLKSLNPDGTLPDISDLTSGFELSAVDGSSNGGPPAQPMDHFKLAADLQAMFSGCLV